MRESERFIYWHLSGPTLEFVECVKWPPRTKHFARIKPNASVPQSGLISFRQRRSRALDLFATARSDPECAMVGRATGGPEVNTKEGDGFWADGTVKFYAGENKCGHGDHNQKLSCYVPEHICS